MGWPLSDGSNTGGDTAAPRNGVTPIRLGPIAINPATREITGPLGTATLEPRMMQVLVELAERPGELTTRKALVERCWHGAPVGDDSLNRAVAGIRRAASLAGGESLSVRTVPGAGYVLNLGNGAHDPERVSRDAIDRGWQSWRLGLPTPDLVAIERLREAAALRPACAETAGMLALLLRQAAEYAEADACEGFVAECEAAAAKALSLDPQQPEARVALLGLPPIYGDWLDRRRRLLPALAAQPGSAPLRHELSVLEMTTGRPGAAVEVSGELYREDPMAAIYSYKYAYQLWSTDQLAEMDRVADRAMQLWPRHPAIWFNRLWTLMFTGRARQARQQLLDGSSGPPLPPGIIAYIDAGIAALLAPSDKAARERAIAANLAAAEQGPVQCSQALIVLSGLGALDAAFAVADGYFLRRGELAVAIRKSASDVAVNEQHRRVTQPLFIPTAAAMRDDPRFLLLCEAMGLADYWAKANLRPDFLGD